MNDKVKKYILTNEILTDGLRLAMAITMTVSDSESAFMSVCFKGYSLEGCWNGGFQPGG